MQTSGSIGGSLQKSPGETFGVLGHQKPREANYYLANFLGFSDQHKRASSDSELVYFTAISPYPFVSQQSETVIASMVQRKPFSQS